MRKKILNIIELLIIGLIIIGIFGFQEDSNSVSRFSAKSNFIRIEFDILIIAILLLRSIQILKNFSKPYSELGNTKILEKAVIGLFLILLLPDLANWYQWYYFANLYLPTFIIFSLPIVLVSVEFIERVSGEKNRIRNFVLTIISFAIPILAYTVHLSHIK